MKVYTVLFESGYEGEDVHSCISTFGSAGSAKRCMEDALAAGIAEGRYTDGEVEDRLVRDGGDSFCFYRDGTRSDWKFRCTIHESEVAP